MIKIDAEFPKTCSECPLSYDDDDCCHQFCVLTSEDITSIKYLGRGSECPIIEGDKE